MLSKCGRTALCCTPAHGHGWFTSVQYALYIMQQSAFPFTQSLRPVTCLQRLAASLQALLTIQCQWSHPQQRTQWGSIRTYQMDLEVFFYLRTTALSDSYDTLILCLYAIIAINGARRHVLSIPDIRSVIFFGKHRRGAWIFSWSYLPPTFLWAIGLFLVITCVAFRWMIVDKQNFRRNQAVTYSVLGENINGFENYTANVIDDGHMFLDCCKWGAYYNDHGDLPKVYQHPLVLVNGGQLVTHK